MRCLSFQLFLSQMGLLMFETSLFESSLQVRSKSGRYMWITGAFNLAVVAVMMVVPLLYPEALPRSAMTTMLSAPLPPPAPPSAPKTVAVKAVKTVPSLDPLTAPSKVPEKVVVAHDDPPSAFVGTGVVGANTTGADSSGPVNALGLSTTPPVVKVATVKPATPAHISSGVVAGNKLSGSSPVYPALAKAARVSGAVVLHAVISKTGAIESLSVVSGPEMLRASAVTAVQDWRYRPYLLNGEPTEVDTTITVNFSFGG